MRLGDIDASMQAAENVGEAQSDINVTPLVDVCLVLLIIFMVVTPMLQKGRPVQLPVTVQPDKKPDEEGQLLVSVDQFGDVYLEQEKVAKELFVTRMQEEFQRSSTKNIVIKGDKRLTFGDVKDVMLMLNDAGFEAVGLITEKTQKSPGLL